MKRLYLRDARMGAGLTKGQLAGRAGMTREHYKEIEDGSTAARAPELILIGEILGMDAQEVENHEVAWAGRNIDD